MKNVKVTYSRPATQGDFKGYDIEYDHFQKMSPNVKALIESDDFSEAQNLFKKETGLGMMDVRQYCTEYQKYANAKRDFEHGIIVYVTY